MTKISKQELLRIAEISQLTLYEKEIDPLIKQLQDLLTYAERVTEVAADVTIPSGKNINVMADDVAKETDTKPLLEAGPKVEEDYFVVPKVLDEK